MDCAMQKVSTICGSLHNLHIWFAHSELHDMPFALFLWATIHDDHYMIANGTGKTSMYAQNGGSIKHEKCVI